MSVGDYLLALLQLAVATGPIALGAWVLRGRLAPGWSGVAARLVEIVLAISMLLWASQLTGALGLFEPLPILLACLLAATAAIYIGRGGRDRRRAAGGGVGLRALGRNKHRVQAAATDRPTAGPETGPAARPTATSGPQRHVWIAAIVAGLVIAGWSERTLLNLDRGMIGFDTLWYHMPFAARFAQDGSILHLHFTDPQYLNWFYPQNSELLHGLGIVLFRQHDVLSPVVNLGFASLAMLAAWCAGRPYFAGPLALVAVAVVLDAQLLVSRAGEANNDVVALAFFLSSIAILLNADIAGRGSRALRPGEEQAAASKLGAERPTGEQGTVTATRQSGVLFVAALAAGLAIGTKLTLAAPVALLTIGVIAIAPRAARGATAVVWLVGVAATGAFWYARNLISAGNPLPWIDLGFLPSPERLLHGRPDHSVAHYLTDSDIWGKWFVPGLEDGLGSVWWAVLALAVVGVVLAALRSRSPVERMLATVAAGGAIAYLFTPLGASGPEGEPIGFALNLRYITAPLCLGLILFALSPSLRERRAELAAFAVLAAVFVVGDEPFGFVDSRRAVGSAAIGVVVAGAVLVGTPARHPDMPLGRRRALAGALALLAVAFGIQGYRLQNDYLDGRYAHPEEKFGLEVGFTLARKLEDERIALAGTTSAFVQYGFYGPDLSNHVQYVGDPGPHGSFGPILDCRSWRQAVNEGEYTIAITAPQFRFQAPEDPASSPERGWVEGDPVAQLLRRNDDVSIFRLTGPLDPGRCPPNAPRFPLAREQREEKLPSEDLR